MEIKGNNMSFIDTALIYTLTSTPGTSLKISRSILGTDINSTTLLELDKDIIKAADDLVITGKHNVTYSDMYVRNIKQWNILYFDDFETKHSIHGWSLNATTTCGYKKNHILGGYCKLSSSEINKVYITEETHTHLRIRGQIYIIDQWENNYLIISVDGKPRWKKSFSWCNAMHKDLCMLKKINVCGHHIPDSIAITFDFTCNYIYIYIYSSA